MQSRQDAKDAKVPTRELLDDLSHKVIGACIEVHRFVGPGLLEGVYLECLASELSERGISFEREVIVEAKSVECLLPVHSAQLLTYLRMTELKLGLLFNFNVEIMSKGIKRVVNRF